MNSEGLVRRVEQIHLGDGRYIGARAIEMEWFGNEEFDEFENEMETLAKLSFTVSAAEYTQMSRLGLVDSAPGGEEGEGDPVKVSFRTDPDLLGEAEEQFSAEWEESYESASEEPSIWNDLDYWEILSID